MSIFVRLLLSGACGALAACGKPPPPPAGATAALSTPSPSVASDQPRQGGTAPSIDACTLLTKEEVGEMQGSPVTNTKSSGRSSQGMSVAQCFYTTAEFSRSISLSVTTREPGASGGRGPRDLWHDSFARFSHREQEPAKEEHDTPKNGDREEEREKESKPPLKVEGVGEEAFWISGIGATLYVLKDEAFIRISIGGPEKDEAKLEHAKALAAKLLARL